MSYSTKTIVILNLTKDKKSHRQRPKRQLAVSLRKRLSRFCRVLSSSVENSTKSFLQQCPFDICFA